MSVLDKRVSPPLSTLYDLTPEPIVLGDWVKQCNERIPRPLTLRGYLETLDFGIYVYLPQFSCGGICITGSQFLHPTRNVFLLLLFWTTLENVKCNTIISAESCPNWLFRTGVQIEEKNISLIFFWEYLFDVICP